MILCAPNEMQGKENLGQRGFQITWKLSLAPRRIMVTNRSLREWLWNMAPTTTLKSGTHGMKLILIKIFLHMTYNIPFQASSKSFFENTKLKFLMASTWNWHLKIVSCSEGRLLFWEHFTWKKYDIVSAIWDERHESWDENDPRRLFIINTGVGTDEKCFLVQKIFLPNSMTEEMMTKEASTQQNFPVEK